MRHFQEGATKGSKTVTISCDHAKGCTKKETFPISIMPEDEGNWRRLATMKGWYVTGRTELCSTHSTHIKD